MRKRIRDFTHRDSGLYTPRFGTLHTKIFLNRTIYYKYQCITDLSESGNTIKTHIKTQQSFSLRSKLKKGNRYADCLRYYSSLRSQKSRGRNSRASRLFRHLSSVT